MRTRSAHGLWSDAGYPRFQRDPFARDVALDPGGTTMPRITALHMLHSTMKTVSAPARYSPALKTFHNRLVAADKKSKVIIVAVMRKMITTLNAMLRDSTAWQPRSA